MNAHVVAETRLAAFVGAPAARLFATGYVANLGVLAALLGPEDVIFSDRLNHASIIDGCRLSRAALHVFPHRDTQALARLLAQHRGSARRAAVVTDAVFSMDGERAPLTALRALCDAHDAWLIVDEAHALGLLGPGGRGACAEAGIRADALVGTLGKAFGVAGAFVAGGTPLVTVLEHHARGYVFSTAPAPALAAATSAAVDLVVAADSGRRTVAQHASRIRSTLASRGWDARGEEGTAIVPVVIGDPRRTTALSESLFRRDVLAHPIRPPTVPPHTSRIRLTAMATHTDAHVDALLDAFAAHRPMD
jgi:8-amino-7-oxononanoate synthase